MAVEHIVDCHSRHECQMTFTLSFQINQRRVTKGRKRLFLSENQSKRNNHAQYNIWTETGNIHVHMS